MQAKECVAGNHEDRAVGHVKNPQRPENERKADGDKRVISGKSDPGGQNLQQDRQNFFPSSRINGSRCRAAHKLSQTRPGNGRQAKVRHMFKMNGAAKMPHRYREMLCRMSTAVPPPPIHDISFV